MEQIDVSGTPLKNNEDNALQEEEPSTAQEAEPEAEPEPMSANNPGDPPPSTGVDSKTLTEKLKELAAEKTAAITNRVVRTQCSFLSPTV